MNRILFCSPVPLDARLGMGKHWLELAEAFRQLAWDAQIVGPEDIAGGPISVSHDSFPLLLRNFLRRIAAAYDVVEYDHAYLPYPRSDFPPKPLFVARCMLLQHDLLTSALPSPPSLTSWLRHALSARRRRRWLSRVVALTDATVRQADVTAVSNDRDAIALARHGAEPDSIVISPPGLTAQRVRDFASLPDGVPERPVVGFVGTFDPRKGMREFPELVDRVAREVPGVTFRLLGTAGMVRDAHGVRRCFPRRMWPRLEIHPRYEPDELPGLLAGVSVGVFPTRVEGFGYGLLEMLASAIPVVAYDAAGPGAILTPELVVPIGDVTALISRVNRLLADPARLLATRRWARRRAMQFTWARIGERTARAYENQLAQRAACGSGGSARNNLVRRPDGVLR
jgi:glycosyltransferase involved in cell wall biosynthesis